MRTELLENFLTLIEFGSIASASEVLGMEASALRKQMYSLEKDFGTLFTASRKDNYKIILTDNGREVKEFAKNFLQQKKLLTKKLLNNEHGYSNYLRLAVVPGLSQEVLKKHIKPLKQKIPNLSYELLESSVQEQEQIILNEYAELGLSNSAIIHPHSFRILSSTPLNYQIICNKNTKYLDIHKSYSIEELAKVPLCLTINSGPKVEQAFAAKGLLPNIVGRSTMRQSSLVAASLDLGITICPINRQAEDPALAIVELREPQLLSEEVLYTRKGHRLSSVAKAFVEQYKAQ